MHVPDHLYFIINSVRSHMCTWASLRSVVVRKFSTFSCLTFRCCLRAVHAHDHVTHVLFVIKRAGLIDMPTHLCLNLCLSILSSRPLLYTIAFPSPTPMSFPLPLLPFSAWGGAKTWAQCSHRTVPLWYRKYWGTANSRLGRDWYTPHLHNLPLLTLKNPYPPHQRL